MQLIEEKNKLKFYGGAIGFMDFEGNFNHAIMIELSLVKSSTAFTSRCWNSRSDEESEMEEVYTN
jgi:anthranilate synthase component 1